MTEKQVWGSRQPVENTEIPYEQPLEKILRQEQFEGLEDFWSEAKEVGDPMQYAQITRNIPDGEDYADTVTVKYPNNRIETYVTDPDLNQTVLSIMGEENHQHGAQTVTMDYEEEVAAWMQDIIQLEDDKTWRNYNEPITYEM